MSLKLKSMAMWGLAAVVWSGTAFADTTLRMKFQEGQTTNQKLTMKQSMDLPVPGRAAARMEIEQIMYQDVKCLKIADGVADLEQTLKRVEATMDLPAPLNRSIYYDSDKKETAHPLAAQLDKALRPMIGTPCLMKSDLLGKISDVRVDEKFLSGVQKTPSANLGGDLMSPEGIARMSQESALQFPEQAMPLGYEWDTEITLNTAIGKMTVNRHHTYKGLDIESGFEKIEIQVGKKLEPVENPALQGAKVELKAASGAGEFLFDSKKGRIVRSHLKDSSDMEISAGNQVIPQHVDVEVTLEDVTKE